MSALKVRQTEAKLFEMFARHLDLSDIGESDLEGRTKILTRCLAAFAVYMQCGCSEVEAAEAVWDGTDDNGLDAVFNDPSDQRIVVVQSKWIKAGSGEPSAADIAVFANGVKDLVEDESGNFARRLQGKFTDISHALNTPGVTIQIVLISTGASVIAPHGTRNLERVITELNGDLCIGDPMVTKSIIGLAEVYSYLATNQSDDGICIDANIFDWSKFTEPYPAYFGTIDGLQLKEWWLTYGKRLLAKNIRHSLGSTDVNEQIRQTAIAAPENFWYFNNGITLIADEAVKAPKAAASRSAGIFQLLAASIVNGAQTVSTLGRVENDERLGQVRVPIRIILLKTAPNSFGAEVTRTNNLQNRIEARDFAAQDPQQVRLQQEMGIEDIEYQFLRSDTFIPSDRSCDLIELTIALACASGDSALAVSLKTGIGRFFADINRAPYKTLFNPNVSGARAFNSILVQRAIDRWIDLKKSMIAKRSGFAWTVLIHGNRILASAVFKRIGSSALSAPIKDFNKSLTELNISKHCEDIYARMIEKLAADYENKFLAVLFKNPKMSRDVFEDASSTTRDRL